MFWCNSLKTIEFALQSLLKFKESFEISKINKNGSLRELPCGPQTIRILCDWVSISISQWFSLRENK